MMHHFRSSWPVLAAAAIAITASADPINWSAYARSFDISFHGYTGSETLTDFPVLVRLSKVRNDFKYAKCPNNGANLRFSDSEGNLLAHEIDTWNPAGESLVWVKVPTFNASTVITAHYDCDSPVDALPAAQVWSNGFIGVWHLGQSARPLVDSTGHGLDFTKSCTLSNKDEGYFDNRIEFASSGIVGNSVAFDKGTAGDHAGGLYAYDTEQTRMDGFTTATLEFWSYERDLIPTNSNGRYLISKYTGSTSFAYMVTEQAKDNRYASQLRRVNNTNFSVNPNSYGVRTLNKWMHNVYVYDSVNNHGYYYMNGVNRTNGTYTPDQAVTTIDIPLCLGNRDSNSQYAFPGSFDELRLSSVARSADWVKATYATVMDDNFAHYELPNDWKYYTHSFTMAFTNYTGSTTLTDFPVLVKVSTNDLPGFLYTDCLKENGDDLRFSDADGHLLASEVDTWDTNGVSTIWVKVPSLSSSTTITAYYGWVFAPSIDPKAVWSNGYVGVWHLGESARPLLNSTATTGVDFTRSHNSSSDPGHYDDCIAFAENGAAGGAVRFSAYTGDDTDKQKKGGLIAYDPQNKLCGFNAISLEIWAKVDAFDTTGTRYLLARRVTIANGSKLRPYNITYGSNKKPGSSIGLENGLDDANANVNHYSNAMGDDLAGSWNFHCFQYDNTATYHTNYLNGAFSTRVSNNTGFSVLAPTEKESFLCLGNDNAPSSAYGTTPQVFNGSIDELRISNVTRSSDWVKATYETIKNNATFSTYSSAKENGKGSILFFR